MVPLKDIVTPEDLIAGGACEDGVIEAVKEASTPGWGWAAREDIGTDADRLEWFDRASGRAGYGDGDGDGDGYGDGDGNGYGDGDGYGNGSSYGAAKEETG